jgi:hypothetical protein
MQHDRSTLERRLWCSRNTRCYTLKIPWSWGIHPSQTLSLERIAIKTHNKHTSTNLKTTKETNVEKPIKTPMLELNFTM